MQVQKQMENEYKFVDYFKQILASIYKQAHSEAIKRGLKAKKLQKQK